MSITSVDKIDSNDTVGEATDSPSLRYFLCLLPSAQALPLTFNVAFFFIRLTAFNACFFYSLVTMEGSMGSITGLPSTTP